MVMELCVSINACDGGDLVRAVLTVLFSGWLIREVYEYFTRCADILILFSKQRLQIEHVHNGTGAFCCLLLLLVTFRML